MGVALLRPVQGPAAAPCKPLLIQSSGSYRDEDSKPARSTQGIAWNRREKEKEELFK